MKTKFWVLIVLAALFCSCEKEETNSILETPITDSGQSYYIQEYSGNTSNDPDGTILVALGTEDDCIPITLKPGDVDVYYDPIGNLYIRYGTIMSVGPVKNIASITTIPHSYWTKEVAAIKGHGYIVRASEYNPNTESNDIYHYGRLYIDEYIRNGNGETIGLYIKYQGGDFELAGAE